uniref:Formin binding protein 4 n=1 Tax=Xiphophorus couchianus TaxID=32473 RepID=A0A3B5KRI8_9TELE
EQDGDGHRFVKLTSMKAPTVKATEGLSLLGAYEDSDEEDGGSRSASNSQHNQPADIDSTLANFMAEIDAITTQPAADDAAAPASVSNANPPRPEVKPQQQSALDGHNQQSTEFEYNTQYSLAGGVEMGDWQEVWDENSGCYYYWNTLTNEVSWELPHYLADQVQSLGHYENTSVNENGTAGAGYYAEENAAAASSASKETKAKEIVESVVALTSEEEERQGVAASLLGPLIPSEVKEAEEKWRKRLMKGLDETENSLDSDGEVAKPVGSPTIPFLESDPNVAVQKDVPNKKLSGDQSDAEEEAEEDTVELELALERKKAELRALEEGDGSAGGSSPMSETSQDAAGSRGALLKKNRWKAVFPSVASPDSNSRGSFQIGELANTLTSKMEFLGINKKTISNFHLLLLQTETRIADWREGALNGAYLRRKLQEAAEHIKYYELNATPKGWSCHWDEHRRYFYVRERTGASQWEFPTEEDKTESASSFWSPSQPPLPNSPPPPSNDPPPPPLPPESPPPPPPPPDSDGEIMEVEMDVDDDNEEEPPAPGTEEVTIGSSPILYTQTPVPAPLMPAAAYWGIPAVAAPLIPCEPPAPPVPVLPPQPPLPPSQPAFEPAAAKPLPADKTKKTKKDKKSKTKMPSLVKKWQSIQKELDEEEKSSSSDEDRDLLNKKSIEDWKQQGKASKNANFEALPEDWRDRLKKRKLMNST